MSSDSSCIFEYFSKWKGDKYIYIHIVIINPQGRTANFISKWYINYPSNDRQAKYNNEALFYEYIQVGGVLKTVGEALFIGCYEGFWGAWCRNPVVQLTVLLDIVIPVMVAECGTAIHM